MRNGSIPGLRRSPRPSARQQPKPRLEPNERRTTFPVQSFHDWLRDLATIVKNHIEPKEKSIPAFDMITRPTAAQARALELLRASV